MSGRDSPLERFNFFGETVATPGQIAAALHMDSSVESLKCALHRPATIIESVD
jgi:hypothetical protein